MSKQHLGICQLGLHWEEEEALPQASASLGPCCLPTPGEGADWALARTQLGSAELLNWFCLRPAHPAPKSLEPPACTSPAGPGEASDLRLGLGGREED